VFPLASSPLKRVECLGQRACKLSLSRKDEADVGGELSRSGWPFAHAVRAGA